MSPDRRPRRFTAKKNTDSRGDAGKLLIGKRVLIVVRFIAAYLQAHQSSLDLQDEVDDSRKTLQYDDRSL